MGDPRILMLAASSQSMRPPKPVGMARDHGDETASHLDREHAEAGLLSTSPLSVCSGAHHGPSIGTCNSDDNRSKGYDRAI